MKKWRNPTQEEIFDCWAEELIKHSFIEKYIKVPTSMVLLPAEEYIERTQRTVYKGTKREKVVIDEKRKVLFEEMTYRPDRIIYWAPKAKDVFFQDIKLWKTRPKTAFFYADFDQNEPGWWSAIDVKSPFQGKNCSDATFDVKKKLLWSRFNIYINKCIQYPAKKKKRLNKKHYLYTHTFTPTRYLYTDGLTKARTIRNWPVITIQEFLKAQNL